MKGAGEIDGDDGVPALDREILNARHVLDTGVVHQDVDLSEARVGVGQHGLDFGRLAHVGTVVVHRHAQGSHFGLGAFDVAKAVEYDAGALGCQSLGDTKTDTAGRSGDEGCFAVKHAGSCSKDVR